MNIGEVGENARGNKKKKNRKIGKKRKEGDIGVNIKVRARRNKRIKKGGKKDELSKNQ